MTLEEKKANCKKVLVVDDERILRMVVKRQLEFQGYQVRDASSGEEALSIIEEELPDVIVSDVMMPEMDGLEFCKSLRASGVGQLVPFIFLSSKGDVDDRIVGLSMGADDYLIKPFEVRELVAKIEAQLERSRRISSEMKKIKEQYAAKNSSSEEPDPLPLTPAEERVFWEVVQGLTNKQISDRLFVSPRTVQTHLSNILGKLSLDNRSQLVRFAFENGYKQPTDGVED
ncbi:MAG: response regulator transcription factor [Cyanobacteriota bacterium]|nr:response regulator transcription factor [Cyanobacteriota bacterium]